MNRRRTRRARLPAIVLTLALALATTTAAHASQLATLKVQLTPEQLGKGTTIVFAFKITTPTGQTPSPLDALDFSYPTKLGLLTSGLGLTNCTPAILQDLGPEGCPANSLMGHGTATVELPIGPETITETGEITTWMGPVDHGHVSLLISAVGGHPVFAELIFPGIIVDASPPYGGELNTNIPPIATLPGAPNASVTQMHATIGPKNITYYRHEHEKTTPYQPEGLRLPHQCPHHGFPFAATFTFQDGTHTTAHTTVACPADSSHEKQSQPSPGAHSLGDMNLGNSDPRHSQTVAAGVGGR
jgi:hypothetical protein